MSHDITKEDNVMLERTAWHSLGTVVGESFSWADAVADEQPITLPVTKQPLREILTPFANADGVELRTADDQFANVRGDGLVLYAGGGKQHTVFHAHDGYELGQAIRDESGDFNANLLSLGTLRGGRVWFLTYDLGEYDIVGYTVKDYLTISGSYDSSRQFKVVDGPTLVVCGNTLAASDFGMHHFEFRHTTGIFDRVAAAKAAIVRHRENRDALTTKAEALDAVRLDVPTYRALLNSLFPVDDDQSTRTANANTAARSQVHQMFKGAPMTTGEAAVTDGRRTGFTLVQAVNTWEQHYKTVVKRNGIQQSEALALRQFDTVLDGVQPITHKAVQLVLASA